MTGQPTDPRASDLLLDSASGHRLIQRPFDGFGEPGVAGEPGRRQPGSGRAITNKPTYEQLLMVCDALAPMLLEEYPSPSLSNIALTWGDVYSYDVEVVAALDAYQTYRYQAAEEAEQ
jgi:hypothetical protein